MATHVVSSGAEFSQAIAVAAPGDTVRVLPRPDGGPLSANLHFGTSGTRIAPITVETMPGAVFAPQRAGWVIAGNYWRFVNPVFDSYDHGIVAGEQGMVEGLTIWGGSFRNAGRAGIQLYDTAGTTIDGVELDNIRSGRPGVDTGALVLYRANYDTHIESVRARNIGSDPIHCQPQAPAIMQPVSNLTIVRCVFETEPTVGENGVDLKGQNTGPVYIQNCAFRGYHLTVPGQDASGDAFGSGLFLQLGVHDVYAIGCAFENCETGVRVSPGSEYAGNTGPVHIIGCTFPDTRVEVSRNAARTIVYREDRAYHAPALRPVVVVPEFDFEPLRAALTGARVQLIGVSEQLDEAVGLLG